MGIDHERDRPDNERQDFHALLPGSEYPAGQAFCTGYQKRKPVENLNELEYIAGEIWANIYLSDDIVIINPATGQVTGVVDLKGILPATLRTRSTDVLNGIAYDSQTKSIWITGKYWPRVYKISLY